MTQEIFIKNRPNLSASSVRTYVSLLNGISKIVGFKITNPKIVVEKYQTIIDKIADYEPVSRKGKLCALLVFIENEPDAKIAVDAFRKLMIEDIKEVESDQEEQTLTERQKDGFVTLDEIMEKYNALKSEVEPLMQFDTLDKSQFQRVQLYVLLSCLLLIPPRRSMDYTEFKLRNHDEKSNYFITEKRKNYLLFHIYKTAKKYGRQIIDCPPALAKILKRWTILNPHDWMLMNISQKNKLTSTNITTMLHNFFEKPISTSMLRHIYLSQMHKDTPSIKKMKEIATAMAHSPDMQMKYSKK